jgi:hypothetical protein
VFSHSFDEPVDELIVVVETGVLLLDVEELATELEESFELEEAVWESVETVLTAGSDAFGTEVPSDDLDPPPSRKSVTYHPDPLS